MDLRKLKTLVDLVSESNITELEITEADGKVRIVKGGLAASPVAYEPPASAPRDSGLVEAAPRAPAPPAETGHVIKSPMVGTFYRSSSPGSDAFVEVGDSIKEGEPVCIIEAMKIMNEIDADSSGTIKRILCENGQPVEFGQPLFIVE